MPGIGIEPANRLFQIGVSPDGPGSPGFIRRLFSITSGIAHDRPYIATATYEVKVISRHGGLRGDREVSAC
jgi:hypothetical protein